MGAVLPQLSRSPTSKRVGFRESREGHVKARPEGVHCGAGLGHHGLSQLEGPRTGGWVEPEDQMVLALVPFRGHQAALSSRGIQAEEVEAGLSRVEGVVAGSLNGSQDLVLRLRNGSSGRIHKHLEATTPALRGIKASSPIAAASAEGLGRLGGIFWQLPRMGETLQEPCIQPAGPALGGPCPRSGGHCQAEKGKDSQEAEKPGGQQCQPQGLPSPRLHVATTARAWGSRRSRGPKWGFAGAGITLVQCHHCTDRKTKAHQEQAACLRSNSKSPTRHREAG